MEGDAIKTTEYLAQMVEQLDASKALLRKTKHLVKIEREQENIFRY